MPVNIPNPLQINTSKRQTGHTQYFREIFYKIEQVMSRDVKNMLRKQLNKGKGSKKQEVANFITSSSNKINVFFLNLQVII
jgi:hypothetical protein